MEKRGAAVGGGLRRARAERVSNRSPATASSPGSPAKLKKVVIGSLDDAGLGVEAQYNPNEISIEMSVPWSQAKTMKGNEPGLEFTGSAGRTLSFDLLFDGYEAGHNVQRTIAALPVTPA